MKSILLLAAGVYILLEAIISLLWKYNDKSPLAIGARIARIPIGGVIIWLSQL